MECCAGGEKWHTLQLNMERRPRRRIEISNPGPGGSDTRLLRVLDFLFLHSSYSIDFLSRSTQSAKPYSLHTQSAILIASTQSHEYRLRAVYPPHHLSVQPSPKQKGPHFNPSSIDDIRYKPTHLHNPNPLYPNPPNLPLPTKNVRRRLPRNPRRLRRRPLRQRPHKLPHNILRLSRRRQATTLLHRHRRSLRTLQRALPHRSAVRLRAHRIRQRHREQAREVRPDNLDWGGHQGDAEGEG